MYCSNCGAPLKETDPKCPYCGALNPIGAEAEYMEQLEDIREDTEDLAETAPEEYSQQLKHHSKFALKIALSVIGVCLVLFLVIQGVTHFQSSHEKKQMHKQIAFQKEYFPVLDDLYAAGDDEKVYDYLMDLYRKDGSDALYNWKHEAYYYYYGQLRDIKLTKEQMEKGSYTSGDLVSGFYHALQLGVEGIWKNDLDRMSKADLEKVKVFQQESMAFLTDNMGMTPEEINQAYKDCLNGDFLSYKLCEKYIKKQNGN